MNIMTKKIENKICIKCNIEKNLDEFYIHSSSNDGHKGTCKKCSKLLNKKYYQENKIYLNKKSIDYNTHNKKSLSKNKKSYYQVNKLSIISKRKVYYQENKEKINVQRSYYRENNKEKILKGYSDSQKRRLSTPMGKLSHNIRAAIRRSLISSGYSKKFKSEMILGCTISEFKAYIENQFEMWMNWDNKGLYNGKSNYGWDLDHKIPTSSGTNEDEIIKLNHYTNIQPLCSHYNRDIKRNLILN